MYGAAPVGGGRTPGATPSYGGARTPGGGWAPGSRTPGGGYDGRTPGYYDAAGGRTPAYPTGLPGQATPMYDPNADKATSAAGATPAYGSGATPRYGEGAGGRTPAYEIDPAGGIKGVVDPRAASATAPAPAMGAVVAGYGGGSYGAGGGGGGATPGGAQGGAAALDDALAAAIEAREAALRSVAQLVGLDALAATVWCQKGVRVDIVSGERAGKKGTLGIAADPRDAGYALNSTKARVQLETGQSVMESIANLRPQRAAAGQATGRVLVLVGGRTSQRGAIVGEDEGEFVVEIDGSGGEIEMLAGDKFVISA